MRKLLLVATPILDFYEQNLLPSHMDGFKHNPHLGVYYLASIVRERTAWEVEVLDLAESVAERFPGEERMGLGKLSFTMPLVLKRLLEGEAPAAAGVAPGSA